MNTIVLISGIILTLMAGYVIYIRTTNKKKYTIVPVSYSELVGNQIVEHPKLYQALIDYTSDIMKIPELNITRAVPEQRLFVPTTDGKKKLYIIRIDSFRFGYRVPSIHNSILIEKRDIYGNILTKNGKPIITKFKWQVCDDVVEPDIKHWEEHIHEKLREKHKTKMDMLGKWIAPVMVGLILLAGIITIQMTTKFVSSSLKEQQTLASETSKQVKENAGLVNSIINRVDPDKKQQPPS